MKRRDVLAAGVAGLAMVGAGAADSKQEIETFGKVLPQPPLSAKDCVLLLVDAVDGKMLCLEQAANRRHIVSVCGLNHHTCLILLAHSTHLRPVCS